VTKFTIEQQAAMGRMGYALRATIVGLRTHGEEFDLVLRAVITEAINLALTKYNASLDSAEAEMAAITHEVFAFLELNNTDLKRAEAPTKGEN